MDAILARGRDTLPVASVVRTADRAAAGVATSSAVMLLGGYVGFAILFVLAASGRLAAFHATVIPEPSTSTGVHAAV